MVDGTACTAGIVDHTIGTKEMLPFDLLRGTTAERTGFREGESAGNLESPFGYVDVDPPSAGRHPSSSRTWKPFSSDRSRQPRYGGYTSCPLVTARNTMLLAEFGYDLEPAPTIPFVDTAKERRDMWPLKRYGPPAIY